MRPNFMGSQIIRHYGMIEKTLRFSILLAFRKEHTKIKQYSAARSKDRGLKSSWKYFAEDLQKRLCP